MLFRSFASGMRKDVDHVPAHVMETLRRHHWPGNIRELQNVIERSVILSAGDVFGIDELWLSTQSSQPTPQPRRAAQFQGVGRNEREIIEAALAETRGRVSGPSGAAAKLRIPASTLATRIKALKINKQRFKFG